MDFNHGNGVHICCDTCTPEETHCWFIFNAHQRDLLRDHLEEYHNMSSEEIEITLNCDLCGFEANDLFENIEDVFNHIMDSTSWTHLGY